MNSANMSRYDVHQRKKPHPVRRIVDFGGESTGDRQLLLMKQSDPYRICMNWPVSVASRLLFDLVPNMLSLMILPKTSSVNICFCHMG
jgi:hypothetical protein